MCDEQRMSFHEDAMALARQAIADEHCEEEAGRERERKAREADIADTGTACKGRLTEWMTEMGMIPYPEIRLKDLGLHDFSLATGGPAVGKERRIGAGWIFEGHYYRAKYRSRRDQVEMIEI